VAESPLLGGFGHTKHGELYNEDTLRYFATLVALQDAGVLVDYRGGADRRLVWEIGGGWGGFARQFKTVCPDVTYLITGTPNQLLLSAVYLTTIFPTAHARFYDPAAPCEMFRDWHTADFLFAPEAAVPSLWVPRLDLALDVMTLHGMDADRVALHVRQAYAWGARYFYTQQPVSQSAGEDSAVSAAVAPWFWLHLVPALAEPDGATADAQAEEGDRGRGAVDDVHIVGWRRIRT
jgi:putative sugar O-methyltransferase